MLFQQLQNKSFKLKTKPKFSIPLIVEKYRNNTLRLHKINFNFHICYYKERKYVTFLRLGTKVCFIYCQQSQ